MNKFMIIASMLYFVFVSCNTSNQLRQPISFDGSSPQGLYEESMPIEPGKCYSKAIVKEYSDFVPDTIARFSVGEEIPSSLFSFREVSNKVWTKKPDRNGLLVHCLVEVSTLSEVNGRYIAKDYVEGQPVRYVLEGLNQNVESVTTRSTWQEILCEKDMKAAMTQLWSALLEDGYHCLEDDQACIKEALKKYQVLHRLPAGSFNMSTLASIGILN